jgi:hypothetical protein
MKMRRAITTTMWKMSGLAVIALAAGCGGASGSGSSDVGGGGATSAQAAGMGGSGDVSSGGSTSGGSGNVGNTGNGPHCDTATDNITISGFGTAVAMSGGTPVTSITGENGTAGGLLYESATNSGGVVAAAITSPTQSLKAGAALQVGPDATLKVSGQTGAGQPFLCEAESGQLEINSLTTHSVDPNTPTKGEALDKANVSFTATCKQATVKPAGVTQITGCYNYVAQ